MSSPDLVALFVRPLNELGIEYMATGAVAAILYGEPRITNDIDLVVKLEPADITGLHEAFSSADFYVPPIEYVILRKLEYLKAGGQDKHRNDVAAMLRISGGGADREKLFEEIRRLRLQAQWKEVEELGEGA